MKTFCFTVDDNIRFLKELTAMRCESIFDHPYLAMLRRLHEEFDLKVQLNLFYCMDGFALPQMWDGYRSEWEENAHWLKLSFHSRLENVEPYAFSGYREVFADCEAVNSQILRFASPASLAKTTTVHYCLTTGEGLRALEDHQIKGLLGLYGTESAPQTSYGLEEEEASRLRKGETVSKNGILFAPIDIVLNLYSKEDILQRLSGLSHRDAVWVMIHEQYFYPDYPAYQPDFEEKLHATFAYLQAQGCKSCHFEDLLEEAPPGV